MSYWRWLQTYNGRVFLQWAAFGASATTFVVYHIPHSYCIDKYKEFVQSYSKGMATPVSTRVRALFDDVVKDLKIKERERAVLDLFEVYGFDMFHAGSLTLQTGAIIGVPCNFSYEKESDVDRRIKAVTKTIDWTSNEGKSLLSALVLSEDARRFAIAREIAYTRSNVIWLNTLYPWITIMLTYTICRTLNERLHMRQHPFRFIMYTLAASFGATLYVALTDLTAVTQDESADATAAKLSPAYAKGGVEFYKKLMERNKALRVLMGEYGEKLYTTSGNPVVLFRVKTLPLCDRLRNLEDFSKAISDGSDENKID